MGNAILTRNSKGEMVILGQQLIGDFTLVEILHGMSTYEAASHIKDPNMMVKATDYIGKMMGKVDLATKDRVIEILSKQGDIAWGTKISDQEST